MERALAVFYATGEGQTRRIAQRLAQMLRDRGFVVDVADVAASHPGNIDLDRYRGAILAASVHMGKYQRSMIEFVKARRAGLERLPTTFLAVSLSQAAVEDAHATPARRQRARRDVERTLAAFARATDWRPRRVRAVAGALLYRQYGFALRLLMRFVSSVVGASTDTSRDHDYTDWNALARYADEIAADPDGPASSRAAM